MLPTIPWHRRLWHKWKALRNIPLRKTWFVGYDLDANSYWEFKDGNNAFRLRRRAFSARGDMHMGDFQPVPQWMQWLRFTRPTPPSLQELLNDLERQKRLKVLAKQAEERWQSIPLRHEASRGDVDPRIDSAWTGAPAAKEPVYAQPASPAAQPTRPAEPAAAPAARVADAQKLINERDAKARADKEAKAKQQKETEAASQASANATAKKAEDAKRAEDDAEAELKKAADPWAAADEATQKERASAVLKPSSRG